jgi:predicted DNA-binding protein (MmcQ/YjbR family)
LTARNTTVPAHARPVVACQDVPVSDWRAYCLAKPGAWPDEPWDGDSVAKVGDKIFAFLGGSSVGMKCGTREEADEWLLRYPEAATKMPYIGAHGWNSLRLDGSIPDDEIAEALDLSYELVVAKLPRSRRPATG